MEKYKTIKQMGRKYLASAIVAGALVFGGNAYAKENSLPIYEGIRTEIQKQTENLRKEVREKREQELENLASDYSSQIESARNIFNSGISDRKLTKSEQKRIYSKYKDALKNAGNLKKLSKEYNIQKYSNLRVDASDRNLYTLLDKNLKMFDFGVPNLEKKLNQEGLDVKVEPVNNYKEGVLATFSSIPLATGLVFLLVELSHRKKK